MAISGRKLADEYNTTRDSIRNAKKALGITGEMTDAEELAVREKLDDNARIKKRNKALVEDLKVKKKRSRVRRIDKIDGSTMREMLKDAKERYVANERVIEQLQSEINANDVLTVDNANGSLSTIPQLQAIQQFTKINITLRTQIAQFEQMLEISEANEQDPFA